MKRIVWIIAALSLCASVCAQELSVEGFSDCVNHWRKEHGSDYARYKPSQFRQIADNIVAYQNQDGGWPKNIDMLAMMRPDSVRSVIDAKHLRSTLDNTNVYTQVGYLCDVYYLTGDTTYRHAARRGMEYMLAEQCPNGGWRGWDADAVTFNDGVMTGVLSTWLEVLQRKPAYAWVEGGLLDRIRESWEQGLALVLACQYEQDGVKTVWPQQCDHRTLEPVKARAYELPALSASESAGVVELLMRIDNPSAEVVAAVKAAAAWFERSAITGKKLITVEVPEGLEEDRKIKRDRRLVDDPGAGPLWARFYDPRTNRPFLATRSGEKVYSLAEVPAERRVGYAWYGTWGRRVLKAYPDWLVRTARETAKTQRKARK